MFDFRFCTFRFLFWFSTAISLGRLASGSEDNSIRVWGETVRAPTEM